MGNAPNAEYLQAWEEGVKQFNSRHFWEAHECWERGWKTLPEPLRTYVQALIQVAGALHLQSKGRPDPARSLAAAALAKLSSAEVAPCLKARPRLEIDHAMEALQTLDPSIPRARLVL